MANDELCIQKKRESISELLVLPCSASMKKRYERIKTELDRKQLTKLHDISRRELESMLDRVEATLTGMGTAI